MPLITQAGTKLDDKPANHPSVHDEAKQSHDAYLKIVQQVTEILPGPRAKNSSRCTDSQPVQRNVSRIGSSAEVSGKDAFCGSYEDDGREQDYPQRKRPASNHSRALIQQKKAKTSRPAKRASQKVKATKGDAFKINAPQSTPLTFDSKKADHSNFTEKIDEAMKKLPCSFTKAYFEAKTRIPDILEAESRYDRFLHRDNYNMTAAARRLALYWKKRYDLFDERAFLPMSQTGEGTIARKDMSALGSGAFLVLPRDKKGNGVFFVDASKFHDTKTSILDRVAFYMMLVACECSTSNEIVVLYEVGSIESEILDRFSLTDLLPALPAKISAVHLLTRLHTENEVATQHHVTTALQSSCNDSVDPSRIYQQNEISRAKLLHSLEQHGLERAGLPKWIGGGWGIANFTQWLELRTRYEWGLPPGASNRGVDLVFDFSAIKAPSELPEEERIERDRRMNALHSRRKRERERIEIEVLNEQCRDLSARNREMALEAARLESLLSKAKSLLPEASLIPRISTPNQDASASGNKNLTLSIAAEATLPLRGISSLLGAQGDDRSHNLFPLHWAEQALRSSLHQSGSTVYPLQQPTTLEMAHGQIPGSSSSWLSCYVQPNYQHPFLVQPVQHVQHTIALASTARLSNQQQHILSSAQQPATTDFCQWLLNNRNDGSRF